MRMRMAKMETILLSGTYRACLINFFEDAKSDQFFPQKNKQWFKKKQKGNAVTRIQITLSEPPSEVV